MHTISENTSQNKTAISKNEANPVTNKRLKNLAFENAAQANIITVASSGKILLVNNAACKLLGYSKRELLTKSSTNIFDFKEGTFKAMLKQRNAQGHAVALCTAIKKNGRQFFCEITSAVFLGEHSIEKAVTTISDLSKIIQKQKSIDAQKEKVIHSDIALAKAKQKRIDVKKEKKVRNNIALAKSKQKEIDIQNKETVNNSIMVAQAKADAWQTTNNKWLKHIGKTSYDVMWDWDIASGRIYVGDSVEEIFGYRVQSNTVMFKDFTRCLLPVEKDSVEKNLLKALYSQHKSWNDSYMFKRRDSSIASVISRASIIRNEDGDAIRLVGATQDITMLQDTRNKLQERIALHQSDSKKGKVVVDNFLLAQLQSDEKLSEIIKDNDEKFKLAAKLSFDTIWNWNLLTNEFFFGEGFEELVGYIKKNSNDHITNWSDYLHPDDRKAVIKGLLHAVISSTTYWEQAFRLTRVDGSIASVFGRANIIRHTNGKALQIIGIVHDLSLQNDLEEKLEHEIKSKEKQIANAADDAREMERSNMGKELHDNINQLLVASRMYLEMAKRGGENRELYLNRSSEYTLTATEDIRKLTKGLTTDIIKNFGLAEAVENVIRDTIEVTTLKISFQSKGFIEKSVSDKFKLNVYRIVQEQLNNILKHAGATNVVIALLQNKKSLLLTISDNGVGFNTGQKRQGIGMDNILSRATSYNGIAEFISQPGQGCVLKVIFPVPGNILH